VEINEQYAGTYDFFYLPIDFQNKCNIGYAFINFVDPATIVKFYAQFNERRWINFNSGKICAVAYARIQVPFQIRSQENMFSVRRPIEFS